MKTKLHTYLNSFACRNLSEDQKMNVLVNFDKLVNSGMFDEEGAYTRIFGHLKAKVEAMASYEEMEKPTLENAQPLTPLGKAIHENLKLAAQKKVSKSPNRVRAAIARYRANLSLLGNAEILSAFTKVPLTVLDDAEMSRVKNRWQELEASKADALTKWESYAESYGLKEKQTYESIASENLKSNVSRIECLVFEILG